MPCKWLFSNVNTPKVSSCVLIVVANIAELLEKHQLQGSMSAKGNCYDNACAESFFHSLKVEAIHGERFVTREAMRQTVFEYIETDYNRLRLHSANHYRSPVDFEADFYQPLAS